MWDEEDGTPDPAGLNGDVSAFRKAKRDLFDRLLALRSEAARLFPVGKVLTAGYWAGCNCGASLIGAEVDGVAGLPDEEFKAFGVAIPVPHVRLILPDRGSYGDESRVIHLTLEDLLRAGAE